MAEVNKIQLLIATGLYPPEIGGPATYSRMLEENLSVHGFDVAVIPFSQVRHLPKLIRHCAFFWHVLKAGRSADIIYALDPVSVGVPAYCASVLLRKRFMVRLGGDYAWEQGQQRFGLLQTLEEYTATETKTPLPVRALAAIQGFIVRRALLVISPSEYLKRIIASWGVDPSRIKVIYSALVPLGVSASRSALRTKLGYEGTVITTAGRLVPWKGFRELIDVFDTLQKERSGVSLHIIGDGPLYTELKQKISDLGLEQTVHLFGRLNKEALGEVIKASDLFVLNTSYEGLSHQLLEVMELGVPIVTTRIGGNPEILSDGVSGLLIEPNNSDELCTAIVRLLDNEDLRTRMAQNARVRLQQFSESIVMAHLASLIAYIYKNK